MNNHVRNILISAIGIVGVLAGTVVWQAEHNLPLRSFGQFQLDVADGSVQSLLVQGVVVRVTAADGFQYQVVVAESMDLVSNLAGTGVDVEFAKDYGPVVQRGILVVLPVLLLIGAAWLFQLRRQQSGGGVGAMERRISFKAQDEKVSFQNVAGIPEAKEELLEIINFLKNPEPYRKVGAVIPQGILLQGPPGTGKTLLARATAGEAGVPFFNISGSDFVEMFVGVGASRVRELFAEAKKNAPCIVFIDEIDAVGISRGGSGSDSGNDERSQTLNALLVEMDGFSPKDTVVVLAATNRPDILDPALRRPGRFDRQITILPPDVKGRARILEVCASLKQVGPDVCLDQVAQNTPGFTGAELANLVNEAALLAARQGKDTISSLDFEAARDRILMGVERKGLVISENDRRTMAFHEAGHAIIARNTLESDPLHKITIIPRGRALGQTQQIPLTDRHAYSRVYLEGRIITLMGGRAAEEIVFRQHTTGAQDDLRQATEIATSMICLWGMSEKVGPRALALADDGFLRGQDSMLPTSEETARLVDQEVKSLLEHCYQQAIIILTREKCFMEHLDEILLQTETLDNEELDIIFDCSQKKQAEKATASQNKHQDHCASCPASAHCSRKFAADPGQDEVVTEAA